MIEFIIVIWKETDTHTHVHAYTHAKKYNLLIPGESSIGSYVQICYKLDKAGV